MSSSRRYSIESSSHARHASRTTSSSARPHYRLPLKYRTGYDDDYYNRSSSTHMTLPAGYRDFHTTSSSSHGAPRIDYRDLSVSSSTSRQTPTDAYGYNNNRTSSSSRRMYHPRHEAISTSSTRQTYQPPIIADESYDQYEPYVREYDAFQTRAITPDFTTDSGSTRQEALTLGDARDQIMSLRRRLRGGQTTIELADLYDEAERLNKRLQKVGWHHTTSLVGGVGPIDALRHEVDEIMLVIALQAGRRGPMYELT